MDSLFLSERILISSDECKKLISGGILVANEDGRIKRIFTSQEEINSWMFIEHGGEVYDFGKKVIMPGLIDANVSICSGTDLEDFSTITKAAAAGGFTTIVDNPMFSVPATTNLRNFKTKVDQARKNCLHVDCAFWGGVTGENDADLLTLANNGVCGFKGFMNPQDGYPDFQNLTKESLKSALEVLEETDCIFAIKHDMEENEPKYPDENQKFKEYSNYLSAKPPAMEKLGVQTVIDLIKTRKMKIHLTDVSSSEVLPMIQKYQNMMTPKMSKLTFETSHHYLSLNSEDIENGKTEFKTSPPIRNKANQNNLWEAMKNYEVFNVSSSHMPTTLKSKCMIGGKNRGNFIEAANGIASLQFCLPVFWTNCQKHSMTILDVNRFLSYHPAKLTGLDQNKGRIQAGYDADFCIWDPDEEWQVMKDETFFKNKICPYYGKTLKGRVYATVVRGYFVYDVNNPSFDEPIGNVLLRKPMRRIERAVTFLDGESEG